MSSDTAQCPSENSVAVSAARPQSGMGCGFFPPKERTVHTGGPRSRALDREEVVSETQKQGDKCPAMYLVQQLTANFSNIPGNFAGVRASAPAEAAWRVHVSGATQPAAAPGTGTLATGSQQPDTAEVDPSALKRLERALKPFLWLNP